MDDLVRWLGEQLEEDERIARSAGGMAWLEWADGGWVETAHVSKTEWKGPGDDGRHVASVRVAEDRAHIVRHDPARVLREIDAKRQLLGASNADCPPPCRQDHTFSGSCMLRWMGPVNEADGGPWVRAEDGHQVPAPPVVTEWVLRLLALPYADRPGYRDEWRP